MDETETDKKGMEAKDWVLTPKERIQFTAGEQFPMPRSCQTEWGYELEIEKSPVNRQDK